VGLRSTRVLPALALLALYVSTSLSAWASGPAASPALRVHVSLAPRGGGKWAANVSVAGLGLGFECSGVVAANPYYRETRAVSDSLLVLPLYYIIDSVCPRAAAALSTLAARPPSGVAVVAVEAPRGYLVATPLGWGRGSVEARVGLPVFLRYTMYDGVVVADAGRYRGVVVKGLLVVEPRGGVPGVDPRVLASAVGCVGEALRRWLGPSPAAPRVFVAVPPGEHGLVLPGTGYSLGAVVYVKPQPGSLASMVHLVSHEAVHGWVGKGPLRGGEGLVEGAAELLSLLALRECSPRLYNLSLSYEERASSLNPYRTWLLLHAALRYAGLQACGRDIYLEALHELYTRAGGSPGAGPGLPELYAEAARVARGSGCLEALEKALGAAMLRAAATPLPRLLAGPPASPGEGAAPSRPHSSPTKAAAEATPQPRPRPAAPLSSAGPAASPISAPPAPPPRGPGAGAWAAVLAAAAAALAFLTISRVVRSGHESV